MQRRWYFTKRIWGIGTVIFIGLFCLLFPINAQAYFGKNEDYILADQKPAEKVTGHYLEFVSEEKYTVKAGDNLWKIAKKYWGSGAYYKQIISDNSDVIDEFGLILPGTELLLKKNVYTAVGLKDYIDNYTTSGIIQQGDEERAFPMEDLDLLPYTKSYVVFVHMPLANDLEEVDPYGNWEVFQKEVTECSEKICGELVSDLTFERYQVTGAGRMCGYSFVFDAGDTEYIIMAYLCYNDTTKSEAFAVCKKGRCSEKQMKEMKGKAMYAAVRYLDPGASSVKSQDFIGWEDWNYPQLRNPFTDAMHNLYEGALRQVTDYPDDEVIEWKETALEELVREGLAELWQLTPEEKEVFMSRDMTTADLSGIEELEIGYYYDEDDGEKEKLSVKIQGRESKAMKKSKESVRPSTGSELLTTLEDLENFRNLKGLTLTWKGSDITNLSDIGKLVNLRSLYLNIYTGNLQVENIDFLSSLVNLRRLGMCGRNWYCTKFFNGITDLSVLTNCPHLRYLTLYVGNVEDYDFLQKLPEIYYFKLESVHFNDKEIRPDKELLPNACFIFVYGDTVRHKNGLKYE